MDLQSKSEKIRGLVKTGGFSDHDIAALVHTSPATVRAVRSRMRSQIKTAGLAERVLTLETQVTHLHQLLRTLTGGQSASLRARYTPTEKPKKSTLGNTIPPGAINCGIAAML